MEEIKYRDTQNFSKLFLDYIQEDPKLKSFYEHSPSLDGIKTAIDAKLKSEVNREALHRIVSSNYQGISSSSKTLENIERLKNKNCFTITTGHQLSIFTGEWYFIYKIISCIVLAKEAKIKYPEYDFVPVFWMASEDHDFDEINHINLYNQHFTWKLDAAGACGDLPTKSIESLIKSLESFLKDKPYSNELIQLFRDAYLQNQTLSSATFHLVNELFKNEGLVIIEPKQHELKKLFVKIIEEDVFTEKSYHEILKQTNDLEQKGYKSQIHPREINFFYLQTNFRERIVKKNEDEYTTLEGTYSFSKESLVNEMHQFPERFSPNVCMRPMYQEYILPNIAYIGGPGEIAYWLQLKSAFNAYSIPFPMLVWRNSFMIMNTKDYEILKDMQLSPLDLFADVSTMENTYVRKHSKEALSLQAEIAKHKSLISEIKLKLESVDSTLSSSAEAVETKITKLIHRLEVKLLKAEKKKHSIALSRIERLKSTYFPGTKLQERSENFSLWYANCGMSIIDEIQKQCKPLSNTIKIIVVDKKND